MEVTFIRNQSRTVLYKLFWLGQLASMGNKDSPNREREREQSGSSWWWQPCWICVLGPRVLLGNWWCYCGVYRSAQLHVNTKIVVIVTLHQNTSGKHNKIRTHTHTYTHMHPTKHAYTHPTHTHTHNQHMHAHKHTTHTQHTYSYIYTQTHTHTHTHIIWTRQVNLRFVLRWKKRLFFIIIIIMGGRGIYIYQQYEGGGVTGALRPQSSVIGWGGSWVVWGRSFCLIMSHDRPPANRNSLGVVNWSFTPSSVPLDESE